MKVKALKECFHIGFRCKGDVFEYGELAKGAKLPAWLERMPDDVPEQRAEVPKAERETPVAMSELTKARRRGKDNPQALSEVEQDDPDLEPDFLR
jgi:hypothetical protein